MQITLTGSPTSMSRDRTIRIVRGAAQDVDEAEPEAAQMIEAPGPWRRIWDELLYNN